MNSAAICCALYTKHPPGHCGEYSYGLVQFCDEVLCFLGSPHTTVIIENWRKCFWYTSQKIYCKFCLFFFIINSSRFVLYSFYAGLYCILVSLILHPRHIFLNPSPILDNPVLLNKSLSHINGFSFD